jgi:hypothetical protein
MCHNNAKMERRVASPWRHDFCLLVGGAAATLVGLMFVAISLGSRSITERSPPDLRVFVDPTLIHFIYVL